MRRFRITRFTATMIAIAVVASGVGVFLFLDLYRSQQDSRRSYAEAVRGLDLIGDLQYDAQEARRTLLYALVTTDSNLQVDYADQSRAADAEVARHIVDYRNLANGPRESATAEKLSADWTVYLAVRDKLIALMLEGDPKAAVALDLRVGVPAFNAMRVDLEKTKQLFKTSADQLLQDVDVSFQRSLLRLAFILGMLAVLGFVGAKMAQDRTLLGELRETETRLREDFARVQRGERAAAEALRLSQQKLIETSRYAGMAEVATGVLHNVGNVLNSVNVSAGVVLEKLRRSKAPKLVQAAALLTGRNGSLAEYLTQDEHGRKHRRLLGKRSPAALHAMRDEKTNARDE